MFPKVKENIIIKKEISRGGTACVYYAYDKWAGKEVAVKELFKSNRKDTFIRHKFKQEANLYLYLNHQNIVKLTDYVEKEDADYIIMEYVPGKNLDEYIRTTTGPLVDENLLKIFKQVFRGVAHAHHNHVFHLDIKPANILITQNLKVKVVDFGISSSRNEKIESAKRRMGTPMYMSPEQVEMKKAEILSDIYSLGVTLFYAVTAHPPYTNVKSIEQIFEKIKFEKIQNIKNFYPHAPDNLQKVIEKATAKKPSERYQTCEEFEYFLEKAILDK